MHCNQKRWEKMYYKAKNGDKCGTHSKNNLVNDVSFQPRIALTFTYGMIENGVKMQQLGQLEKRGYTIQELSLIQEIFVKLGAKCELINLNAVLDVNIIHNTCEAGVLIIRNGINILGIDSEALFKEQIELPWDVKKLNKGLISNSVARRNLCYADFAQKNNYNDFHGPVPKGSEVKGTIINFSNIKYTQLLREKLVSVLPKFEDVDNSRPILCEGNLYYARPSFIGAHGDSERKTVICCSLGSSANLKFQWHMNQKPLGNPVILSLNNSDIYIMSEKATGNDWKKHANKLCTLRHSACYKN